MPNIIFGSRTKLYFRKIIAPSYIIRHQPLCKNINLLYCNNSVSTGYAICKLSQCVFFVEIELPGSKRVELQDFQQQQNGETLTVNSKKLIMLYFYDKIYFE